MLATPGSSPAGGGKAYVAGAVTALLFKVLAEVVQAFENVPGARALAPTQTGPAFEGTQLVVLIFFAVLRVVAGVRFRKEPGWRN
jgi:hypothetical protein